MTNFLKCSLAKLQSQFNHENRNPILIVSQPVCSESLILNILGENLPYDVYDPANRNNQIKKLKNKLDSLMGNPQSTEEQIAYYRRHLTLDKLEKKRKIISELNLLIKMMTK